MPTRSDSLRMLVIINCSLPESRRPLLLERSGESVPRDNGDPVQPNPVIRSQALNSDSSEHESKKLAPTSTSLDWLVLLSARHQSDLPSLAHGDANRREGEKQFCTSHARRLRRANDVSSICSLRAHTPSLKLERHCWRECQSRACVRFRSTRRTSRTQCVSHSWTRKMPV